jgi:hypothetical protein
MMTRPYLSAKMTKTGHMEAVMASRGGHYHLVLLVEERQDSLLLHTLMHSLGHQDTIEHDELLRDLVQLEVDILRARSAIWS